MAICSWLFCLFYMVAGFTTISLASLPTPIDSTPDDSYISSEEDNNVDTSENSHKPYSTSRPSYGKTQVEEVWENAKDENGRVFDPNTGEELFWDKSRSRNGQWDMGHTKNNKYSVWHAKYMAGEITKEEFLQWYRDPANYVPESPHSNRSHKYE